MGVQSTSLSRRLKLSVNDVAKIARRHTYENGIAKDVLALYRKLLAHQKRVDKGN